LQEIKAPTGYLLPSPNPLYASQITPTGSLGSVDTYNMPTTPEPVIRGGVAIDKRDIESMLDTPLGSASLDGATFAITSQNDNTVRVDGAFYTKGEVVKYIQSSGGVATTQADTLPFGHYTLHETAVGAGYLLSGETRSFDIVEDGKIVHLRGAAGIANQVKRGDIEFIKTSEADMSRLAKVPFRLTSQTTGESHILVTDANGYASTENSWNAH
ncbi:MAG: prealbumin-like fold domain-containing protein, partial [Mucinivorans sp.]